MRELDEQEIGAVGGGNALGGVPAGLGFGAVDPLTVTFGSPLDHWFYQSTLYNGASDPS